jgi:hypothetical protein
VCGRAVRRRPRLGTGSLEHTDPASATEPNSGQAHGHANTRARDRDAIAVTFSYFDGDGDRDCHTDRATWIPNAAAHRPGNAYAYAAASAGVRYDGHRDDPRHRVRR